MNITVKGDRSVRFVAHIDAPAPPAAVFDFVSDFENLPYWDPSIVRVTRTSSGPLAPGVSFDVTLGVLGVGTTLRYVVETYDAPNRAVLVGTSPTTTAVDAITVEATPTGSRVTWQADIELAWPMRPLDAVVRTLFAPLVRRAIGNLEGCLRALPAADVFPAPRAATSG